MDRTIPWVFAMLALVFAMPALATSSSTLSLDGTFDRLTVRNAGVLNPPDAITIEAWVYPTTTDGCQAIVSKGANTGYWLGICGGEIRYYINGLGSSRDSSETIPAGQWSHVAVTYDGSTLTYYINGNASAAFSGLDTPLPVTATDLGIGGDATDAASDCASTYCEWTGSLAEVRLWRIARTQQAIRADLVRQVDDERDGLVAAWPLDGAAAEVRGRHNATPWNDAGFGFGIPAPPEPHQPLALRRLGGAPVVDGDCTPAGSGEYANAVSLPLWFPQAGDARPNPGFARIGAVADALFVCIENMDLEVDDALVVYVDSQGDGAAVPQSDDYRFVLTEGGTAAVTRGSGSGGYVSTSVAGFDAAVGGAEFDWSAELRLPRPPVPNGNADFALHVQRLHRHSSGGPLLAHSWPLQADDEDPASWAGARIDDTAAPPADSRAPAFVDPLGDAPGLGFAPPDEQPRAGVEFTIQAVASDDVDLRAISVHVDDRRFLTREAERTCILDGSADTRGTCSLPLTLPVGVYFMSARAEDHRGRVTYAGPDQFRVVVDGEPPALTLRAEPPRPAPGDSVTFTAAVTDPTGVDHVILRGGTPLASRRCELGGATAGECSFEVTPPPDVAVMRYSASAEDLEGFTSEAASRVVMESGGADGDGDGLPDAAEAALCTDPRDPDSDRDGLVDSWEVRGVLFDDGGKVDLPALGANPCLRDVFLQLDYEQGARLPREGIDEAILRYRTHGIHLHVDEHQRPRLANSADLSALRAAYQRDGDGEYWFPPRRNWTHLYMFSRHVDGRSFAGPGGTITIDHDGRDDADRSYRFIHELGHGVGLGHGGRRGSRSVVEDPEGFFYLDNDWIDTNFKPNHRSAMSYLWTTRGPFCATGDGIGRPDFVASMTYSSGELPGLDESALDESPDSAFATALQSADCPDSEPGATPVALYTCLDPDEPGMGTDPQARYMMVTDGTRTLARLRHGGSWDMSPPAHEPGIDWNCNGVIDSGPVSASVNGHGRSTGTRWPFTDAGELCDGTDSNGDGRVDEFCNWPIDGEPLADVDEWANIPNLKKRHWPYDNDAADADGNRCYRQPADYRNAMGTLAEGVPPVDARPDPLAPPGHCPRDMVTAMPETGVPDGGMPPPPGTELCNGLDDDGDTAVDEGCADTDGDGVVDTLDYCPHTPDPEQADSDGDRVGDACESPVLDNLTANRSDQSVELSWDGPTADLAGYNVYRATAQGQTPVYLGSDYPATTALSFTDAPPDALGYRYTVRPVDLGGEEQPGASVELGSLPAPGAGGGDSDGGQDGGGGGGGGALSPGWLLALIGLAALRRYRVTALAALLFAWGGLHAATITVDEALDDDPAVNNGACSLREAVIAANTNAAVDDCVAGEPAPGVDDVIAFDGALDGLAIVLDLSGAGEDAAQTGDLDLAESVWIIGNGTEATIVDGNGTDRVFDVQGGEVTINQLTIRNGGSVRLGGGVRGRDTSGALSLISTRITGNEAGSAGAVTDGAAGGGVWSRMVLSITASTVSGNRVATPGDTIADDAEGGGVYIGSPFDSGTGRIEESRIVGNTVESTNQGAAKGGGVAVEQGSGDVVRIIRTEVAENIAAGGTRAGSGAGVSAQRGMLTLENTTVSGNQASGERVRGAGVWARELTLPIVNSTITGNTANCDGGSPCVGGLYDELGTGEQIANSILAANGASGGSANAPDCDGDIGSSGYNLIGDNTQCSFSADTGDLVGDVAGGDEAIDPMLGPLADNGGLSRTHGLIAGSPAIDAADPNDPGSGGTCLSVDQRNEPRPADGNADGSAVCDMGAFEGVMSAAATGGVSGGSSGGGGALGWPWLIALLAMAAALGRPTRPWSNRR